MSDAEETAPITPLPHGVLPAQPVPPTVPYSAPASVPYGPGATPVQHWQTWQQPWVPAYGAPYVPTLSHTGATASLVLGIIAIVALVLAPFTCLLTLPGVLCAPFAWVVGARARREIDRFPGTYRNRGAAQAGMWMGVVTTLLGALAIGGLAALIAAFSGLGQG